MYGLLQADLKQSMNKDGGAEADKSLQNLVENTCTYVGIKR